MTRFSVGILVATLAQVLTACASKTVYNPFKVPPEQVRTRVKVVALGPMILPRDLENPDPVRRRFLGLIESQLRDGGIAVVAGDRATVVWDSMANEAHGLFDPATGRLDSTKANRLRREMLHQLKAEYHIDALLYSHIAVVPAKLDNDQARWDGTSQGAGRKKFWKAVLGVSHSGTIPALSLHVLLSDADDVDLYQNAGGIQVLGKIGVNDMETVPRQDLFVDEERNAKAVHLALDPLVGRKAGN